MARLKLYRKPGKKYRTELRPSRIEILILPLLICFLISIVVWCYATGHSRSETQPPVNPPCSDTADTADTTEAPMEGADAPEAPTEGEDQPAESEGHPSDV
jgi:hypothetical protein